MTISDEVLHEWLSQPPKENQAMPDTQNPPSPTDSGIKQPDITSGQMLGLVAAILGTVTAFGLDLSVDQQQAVMTLAGAIAVVLPIVDAYIRGQRNKRLAAELGAPVIINEHPANDDD